MDGVYIHHLVKELEGQIINKRINKVYALDNYSFLFVLQGKVELYLSLNPDISHIRINTLDLVASSKVFPIYSNLKRYLESSVIKSIIQIDNDRIIRLGFEAYDDLGFKSVVYLFLELFGRNANLFLTDEDKIIIDCLKKTFVLEDSNQRILVPKMKYQQPVSDKVNPFLEEKISDTNKYQGLSNLLYTEIIYKNDLSIINKSIKPQIIKKDKKYYFSCIDLTHLNGEVTYYPSLSKVLEEYYNLIQTSNQQNYEQKLLENYLKREIIKINKKIEKQKAEFEKAKRNLNLKYIGDLLSSNLYKVKKNDSKITVLDFYNNNEEITIELDPLLSPAKNLENIYNRYKKAKRAVQATKEQIEASINELKYHQAIENQLTFAKHNELKEIIEELGLIKVTNKQKKKQKPQLEHFQDKEGNQIWVGKNNVQNNYLTHEFAQKNDYFFHVKDFPGSHTILRASILNDEIVELAAMIAAYYSKSKYSSNVAVDYTKVSNVRKVPKQKGSFVTYKDYKTVYVTPDIEEIKKRTI
jgi:predicted ribosome quality control (RQC) complex YloA/Tae2 family protein